MELNAQHFVAEKTDTVVCSSSCWLAGLWLYKADVSASSCMRLHTWTCAGPQATRNLHSYLVQSSVSLSVTLSVVVD